MASQGGQYFVLRQTQEGGYEETGQGRTHPKVVEIYTALMIEHHNDEHARRRERPKRDDFLL
ncbi:hypothetical protein [Nonomuraea aridisoli]|uniref:Uncharacterized protein n=1 Tax=Nonomuraea aridisoli TaxID=2070368 RepID=A0A2W2EFV9_9ACTN|nr:hypothetical protein [Nonomuraea aridisoli]PZG23152.1 hypothetical protein C1J01_02060 [Nonomuraea aridisoli]